ncbi:MAG TPA: metallophosphoesterase family protein [Gaiellaceae bacterium]|nr:metallophosphoesterase family protein [Gaiellaceae bacterium]
MRVAALYDIHGNLPALEAVLEEVAREQVVEIVVGGDVLWGPLQSECLAALRAVRALFLAGNCERDVLSAVDEGSRWCRDRLEAEEIEFVSTWPLTLELDIDGLGRALFCHATPRSDHENLTRRTTDDDVASALSGVDADIVVCGHTHVQLDRAVPSSPRLVNAGSVGLPYQGDTGAFWAIVGVDVEFRRTPYDVERAIASLSETGFPGAADIFGGSLRGRISAESATAFFESKRHAS